MTSPHHDATPLDPGLAEVAEAQNAEIGAANARWAAVARARKGGATWAQIADAMAIPLEPGNSTGPERDAYGIIAPEEDPFEWECSCGSDILDYGPDPAGAPQEEGHADTCERWNTDYATWLRDGAFAPDGLPSEPHADIPSAFIGWERPTDSAAGWDPAPAGDNTSPDRWTDRYELGTLYDRGGGFRR